MLPVQLTGGDTRMKIQCYKKKKGKKAFTAKAVLGNGLCIVAVVVVYRPFSNAKNRQ